MPWKKCPYCGEWSYTAATRYTEWVCPCCKKDITAVEESTHPELAGKK